ncbi:high mobility group protein 20A-like [Teleopsis dalmanni]|uniref:high mobility group protein 20A-like n=1 Tax=Teleopsis dalmanni TaxID=139649 RepID=UPI0018CFEA73|nr:high mobility group protein 20A-like [Teleopsis dalmanni]
MDPNYRIQEREQDRLRRSAKRQELQYRRSNFNIWISEKEEEVTTTISEKQEYEQEKTDNEKKTDEAGYVRYMNERRDTMRKKIPIKTAMENNRIIIEEWRQLPEERKASYTKAADMNDKEGNDKDKNDKKKNDKEKNDKRKKTVEETKYTPFEVLFGVEMRNQISDTEVLQICQDKKIRKAIRHMDPNYRIQEREQDRLRRSAKRQELQYRVHEQQINTLRRKQ